MSNSFTGSPNTTVSQWKVNGNLGGNSVSVMTSVETSV